MFVSECTTWPGFPEGAVGLCLSLNSVSGIRRPNYVQHRPWEGLICTMTLPGVRHFGLSEYRENCSGMAAMLERLIFVQFHSNH